MTYIMIGHKKRQGKDTVARIMAGLDEGAFILRFADPLKEIVADMFGVSTDTLEEMKNESPIFRNYLQRFGNGPMKTWFGLDVWKRLLVEMSEKLEREHGYHTVIVPDFRFPAEYIDGAVTINVTGRDHDGDEDDSETALDDWEYDYVIHNTASLADLELQATRVYDMIKENG